jgi:hypothetical protein
MLTSAAIAWRTISSISGAFHNQLAHERRVATPGLVITASAAARSLSWALHVPIVLDILRHRARIRAPQKAACRPSRMIIPRVRTRSRSPSR